MAGTYAVGLGEEKIGTVRLTRWGLYYEISCCCRPVGAQMLELVAQGNGWQEKLGLLAPADGGLRLDRRIPVKRLGEGELTFFVLPREWMQQLQIPIRPEEPFAYLQQLHNAYLVQDGAEMWIELRKNLDEKREK